MAIWQYTFHVLPKESIKTLSPDHHFKKNERQFDDEFYWKLNPINKTFFRSMQNILPKNKSWSNEIDLYGAQESNCFEVLSDDKRNVLSVSFRIDFRNKYESILNYIIEFCSLNGLAILDEELNILPLNYEQVHNIIRTSSQARKYHEFFKSDKLK